MLILLSPAKSLDYESPLPTKRHTEPRLLDDSAILVKQLRAMTPKALGKLMSISDKLADLNAERYTTWEPDFTPEKSNCRQCLFAFTGDVYQGMELSNWKAPDFTLAQKQIRILSGLYGVLRPLDLMQPYRLEMGTKLASSRGKNLYEFWDEKITEILNTDLKKSGSNFVVNLASNEYFSSVKKKSLAGELITPVFKDEKNGKYKIISFYAKKARGMMADHIIRNKITTTAGLKKFKTAGYKFSKADSTDTEIVFLRKEKG
jgi:cytoplasmic iron level regulating protein YaaA (DUF328/UPF0246 family)